MALTLRLNDAEQKELLELKELLGSSTASSTIKQLILNYKHLLEQLESTSSLYKIVCSERDRLKQGVKEYLTAQDRLDDLVYGNEWKEEIEKRLDAYESGTAITYTRNEFDKKVKAFSE